MTVSAPRISPRLIAELERLDNGSISIAELCRRIGAVADRRDLPRPSYERVRQIVREVRSRPWKPGTAEVVTDVMFRSRPPEALLDHLAGIPLPPK